MVFQVIRCLVCFEYWPISTNMLQTTFCYPPTQNPHDIESAALSASLEDLKFQPGLKSPCQQQLRYKPVSRTKVEIRENEKNYKDVLFFVYVKEEQCRTDQVMSCDI